MLRKVSRRAATQPKSARRWGPRCKSARKAGIFVLFPGSIRCAPISFSAAVSSQRGKLHPPRRSFPLALATGSSTAAFRLIDALLLRPLPVKNPEQLYDLTRHVIGFDGKPLTHDQWAYPAFRRMRDAVKDQAELIAISSTRTVELTYGPVQEMEKAHLDYVSGGMFDSFGLRPVAGRLFSASEDVTPGAYPYAVLSHDYWSRRFGKDPNVIGRTFRIGDGVYEIVGVIQAPFTGTSPGTVTDVFLPAMMSGMTERDDASWLRTIARVKPGAAIGPLQARLNVISRAFEGERAKHFVGWNQIQTARLLAETVTLEPAAAGASDLQGDYRRSLLSLGVLVALVLLIACETSPIC